MKSCVKNLSTIFVSINILFLLSIKLIIYFHDCHIKINKFFQKINQILSHILFRVDENQKKKNS